MTTNSTFKERYAIEMEKRYNKPIAKALKKTPEQSEFVVMKTKHIDEMRRMLGIGWELLSTPQTDSVWRSGTETFWMRRPRKDVVRDLGV